MWNVHHIKIILHLYRYIILIITHNKIILYYHTVIKLFYIDYLSFKEYI